MTEATAVPLDIVELVKVTLTGIATILSAIGMIYAAVAAARAHRAELATKVNNETILKVQDNVKLVERNTNSMTAKIEQLATKAGEVIGEAKGIAAGQHDARTFAEGIRQGREQAGNPLASASGDTPVPVVDDVAGAAAVKSAAALESLASSAKKTAEDK